MNPASVSIKNYKSYGDEQTTLDLSGNSVKLIYGNIGAGKTTFVDAIIWCLYGQSLVNQDEVINRKIKKNCKVEFDFFIKEDIYSVIRYRNHDVNKDNLLIFKNHKNISPNKKKDAQALIDEIVGINHKAMINSVMFSSEIYTSFLRVSEGRRLDIIESVLDLKQFRKWADATKKLKKPIEEEYQHVKEEIGKIEYGVNTIQENINEYKQNAKNILEGLKEKKAKLEEEQIKLKKEIKEYKDIDIEKEKELITEHNKVKEYNNSIKESINTLEQQKKEKDDLFSNKNTEYNRAKEKIKGIEKVDFDAEIEKIKKSNEDEKAQDKIDSLYQQREDIQSVISQITSINKEIESFRSAMETTSDKVCYTCGQSLNDEAKTKIHDDLESKITDKFKKKEELEKEKERINNKNNDLDTRIEDLKTNMYNVKSDYTKEELEEHKSSLSELRVKEAGLSKEVIFLNEAIEDLDKRIKEKKAEFLEENIPSKYSEDFLDNISSIVENNKNRKEEVNKELSTISEKAKNTYDKEYIEKLAKKIKTLEKRGEKENKTLEDKGNEIYYYDYLLKMFSNKDYGIKKYVISKMIDLFNANINKYIPLFFDRPINVNFDKNLKESIIEDKEEISFQSFSSGEKTLLDVAIAFSLYMLVKNFFSSDMRFLVFDEILDRNLDENGINAILNIIQEKSKSNSIMVISHRGEYKESFNNKIRVYKEDGFSRLAYE
jgi:DNA repair exonuclease SbcCD ATPase subunit